MIRHMLSKNIFIFSSMSSKSLSVRSLPFHICHFPSSLNNCSLLRRHYHESRNIPVPIWWDFENCNPPSDVNVFRITHFIMQAVRANRIMGPLHIKAFGDVYDLTRANQDALASTGIKIIHVPRGGKNTADRSLLIDLMYWVSQNPPPAHLFLISGDKDFAEVLHRLRMNNYNILIAGIEIPNVLCSVSTIVWHWNSLCRGENLEGKHFNHPPDGLYGPWYGRHDAPLEDPFSYGMQSIRSQIEEFPKSISGLNLRPIPKAVTKQVCQILNSHPNGISLSCLQTELQNVGISLPKDYYGYKKFSHFILSVTRIQLQYVPDRGLVARFIPKKSPVPIESSSIPSTKLVHKEELNREVTSMASSHELSGEDIPEVQQVADVAKNKSQLPPKENDILCSSNASRAVAGSAACHIGGNTESVIAKGSGGSRETHRTTFRKRLSFVGWIKSWWPFRKKVGNTHDLTAHGNEMVSNGKEPELSNLKEMVGHFEKLQTLEQRQIASQFEEPELSEWRQTVNHSGEPKLFSCNSFWEEMESFVFTPEAEILVFHSRSRKDMMLSFQKYGPKILHSLSENDLLLLADLLISDKKWLEERPSQIPPFCVIPIRTPRSNLQKSSECEFDKKWSIPHTVASSPACQNEHTEKSTTEMLADVKKLVNEMLREHPNGCNMGVIRNLFLRKYGYSLDIGKLGYNNLSLLIKSIPGVRTEYHNFFPAKFGKVTSGYETSYLKTQETKLSDVECRYSDNELRDSYSEDDWRDSQWEELGPVSVSNSNESDLESDPMQEAMELKTAIDPEYECDLSDDDSFGSGGDNACLTQSEEQGQPKLNENDSNESNLESEPMQKAVELKTAIDLDYECNLSDDDSSKSGGDFSWLIQSAEDQPKLNESGSKESNLESEPMQKAVELKTAIDPDYECNLSDDDSYKSGGDLSWLIQSEEEDQPKLNESGSKESNLESEPMQKAVELKTAIDPDYECNLSDDDSYKSGGDLSWLIQSEEEDQPKLNESGSKESNLESEPMQKAVELKTAIDPDYECNLSDDDSYKSGGDLSWLIQSEEEDQPKLNVRDSKESNLESEAMQKAVELKTAIGADYECNLFDDDSSKSGGDIFCSTPLEEEGQPKKLEGEDSSLQTLDPVYDSQGDDDDLNLNKVNTQDNGLTEGLNPSRISTPATSSEIHSGGYKVEHEPQKDCSFDAKPASHENKELIKGMLQCFKRANDKKMPN